MTNAQKRRIRWIARLQNRIEEKEEQIRKEKFTLSLYEEIYEGKAVSPNEIERWDAENYKEDIRRMKEIIREMEETVAGYRAEIAAA